MNATQNFRIADSLCKALAIMDERGRVNHEKNSYLLWFEEWKELRAHIHISWETLKRCELE